MPSKKIALEPISSLKTIVKRLPIIFPEGTPKRSDIIRDMAAKTIFAFLYVNAIEGTGEWARPSQVTDMSDKQASKGSDEQRRQWIKSSLSSKKVRPAKTWYAPNSRESIRDDTIRNGLVQIGAVIERAGLVTTSSKPKYALEKEFAKLFDEELPDRAVSKVVSAWQEKHLNKAALARVTLIKKGATLAEGEIQVQLPNGESRKLAPGLSSSIAKAVIEVFAKKFLAKPAVLWMSEPGNKVVAKDDDLAKTLGINIDASKNLPDIMLVDLGADASGSGLLLVFVEVVASDGPISEMRKTALREVVKAAGFKESQIAYVTAFNDRDVPEFKRLVPSIAWGTYAWFASEPDHVIQLRDSSPKILSQLI